MSPIGYVEPPGGARRGSLKQSDVAEMSQLLAEAGGEKWVTDGEPYESRKKALAKAQAYKRALSAHTSTDVSTYNMRVWSEGDHFRFAITTKDDKRNAIVMPRQEGESA